MFRGRGELPGGGQRLLFTREESARALGMSPAISTAPRPAPASLCALRAAAAISPARPRALAGVNSFRGGRQRDGRGGRIVPFVKPLLFPLRAEWLAQGEPRRGGSAHRSGYARAAGSRWRACSGGSDSARRPRVWSRLVSRRRGKPPPPGSITPVSPKVASQMMSHKAPECQPGAARSPWITTPMSCLESWSVPALSSTCSSKSDLAADDRDFTTGRRDVRPASCRAKFGLLERFSSGCFRC